jgi:transposase
MQDKNTEKPRRKYDASFKAEVVNMIAAGRTVPDIARSLGIGENVIYRWRKKALEGTGAPAGASENSSPSFVVSLAEHLALQKRLREVEMERDILKKAVGIFSRPQ